MRAYHCVIDAGHGGTDPGAISRDGLVMEKDVNLNIALLMRTQAMQGDYLFTPLLTRGDDHYVSLKRRCEIANDIGADAFMSIHCNARPMLGKPGIESEVYHYRNSQPGINFATISLNYLLKAVRSTGMDAHNRGRKEGEFYVLRNTRMPAILVEVGFITDPEEAAYLKSVENQGTIARGLIDAIEFHLEGGGI